MHLFFQKLKLLGFVIGTSVFLAGCASEPQGVVRTPLLTPSPEMTTSQSRDYALAVGDEIEIRFASRADMIQTYRIQPDGRVSPPYLKPLVAAGLSIIEFTAALKQELSTLGRREVAPRYLLNVGDELDIRFANYPGLNQIVRVRPDGRITLPHVHSVDAEGKTPEAFERELINRFSEYLTRPDLTVAVRSFSSHLVRIGDRVLPAGLLNSEPAVLLKNFAPPQVFIGGEVARPGVIAYRGRLTLMQAILEVGGHKPTGDMSSVIVLRKSADSALMIRRDLQSDLKDATTNDIVLEASDVVIIPKTGIASFVEILDQYIYAPFAFLRNSTFGFVYNLTPSSTVNVK